MGIICAASWDKATSSLSRVPAGDMQGVEGVSLVDRDDVVTMNRQSQAVAAMRG